MMWRGILGGWVAGGVAGFMWTLIIGNLQGAGLAGLIAGVVWGIYVIRMALCKKYSDFRIALVK